MLYMYGLKVMDKFLFEWYTHYLRLKENIRATEHRYSALESLESQLSNTLPMSSVCIILFLWSYFWNCMQYKGIGAIMKIPLFIGSIL